MQVDSSVRALLTMPLPTAVSPSCSPKAAADKYYSIVDSPQLNTHSKPRIHLNSFNHLTREVLDIEKSRQFYVDILGFTEVSRPPLEGEGLWLHGHGLSLHLIRTSFPQERRTLRSERLRHFHDALPTVDHFAFTCDSLPQVEDVLNYYGVYHRKFSSDLVGSTQIFVFDPDGNVIEISDCAPPVGSLQCARS